MNKTETDKGLSDREKLARLRLIRTDGIGPITFHGLLDRFGSGIRALEGVADLAQRMGRGKPLKPADESACEHELARADSAGAHVLFLGESGYPARMAALEDAPPVLFAEGRLELCAMSAIGIVGARNASASSLKITSRIAADLSAAGVTVVSGLARGIDTAAHRASLESGTIACVAGGIDIFYPPENEALQREIAATGLIVSEMPYGTRPQARHFPRRNRLISGLSDGVVVIEAALRSGSLITARFALEQGRDVYAVPGSPLDPRAQGANRLIRDGAALVQSASDILEDFRAVIPAPKATEQAKVSIETASLQSEADVSDLLTLLSDTPTALDDLVRLSGAPAEDVMAACLELELGGKIARHSGGRVSRIF